jgi:hypothetical protein
MRTPWDPETEFVLVVSKEGDDDGHHVGEPTGEVKCPHCGRIAQNIDYIAHPDDCPQSDVRSEWFQQAR